jgi:hypothetical protein
VVTSSEAVRYHAGQRIDTTKPLEVLGLPPSQWGPIEEAYPEIKEAGRNASFHNQRNTTIYPPTPATQSHLKWLATLGDAQRHVYVRREGRKVISVLIHVEGGYASVHIWRLRSGQR